MRVVAAYNLFVYVLFLAQRGVWISHIPPCTRNNFTSRCWDPRRSNYLGQNSNTANVITNICCNKIIRYFVPSYQSHQVHNSDHACLWTASLTHYKFSCLCTSKLAERYSTLRTFLLQFLNWRNSIIITTLKIFEMKALDLFHL
jgi:hypothetical protein